MALGKGVKTASLKDTIFCLDNGVHLTKFFLEEGKMIKGKLSPQGSS